LSSFSIAQTPTNYSGKWGFDISKSDPGKGGSFLYRDIVDNIIQNPTTISIEEIIRRPGNEDILDIQKFNLDGKETIEKNDMGTTKKIAKWSDDKKILTLTTIMTVDSKDYRIDVSYKLSDNGITMTVLTEIKNPNGERTVIQVFYKKE
ncbi:MAG: hypothetical protein WCJ61_17610, partial [Paludibacter sp.]